LFPEPPVWLVEPATTDPTVILLEDDTPDVGSYRVGAVGDEAWVSAARHDLVPTAESLITAALGDQLSDTYPLFHAGGIAGRQGACLLPAPSGSGKSTLVAALLTRQLTCLGDDVVVYDDRVGKCLPFVKSIALKTGSGAILSPLYGRQLPDPTAARFGDTPVSFLTPPADAWPSEALDVSLLAFPVRRPGEPARFETLARSDALPLLTSQCFNHRRLGARVVHAALDLVRRSEAVVLVYDDLGSAIELIQRVLN
jgi:hypothetical protein